MKKLTTIKGTTFEKLQALAAPHLESYTDDLNKHDANIFANSYGSKFKSFIHCTRRTGTDLIPFVNKWEDNFNSNKPPVNASKGNDILKGNELYITMERNTLFIYFDGVNFFQVDKAKALDLLRDHNRKLVAAQEEKERLQREWAALPY